MKIIQNGQVSKVLRNHFLTYLLAIGCLKKALKGKKVAEINIFGRELM
jgi:hypothetical protein